MLDPFFKNVLSKTQQSWREVVSIATLNGIPVPAFSASLGYYPDFRNWDEKTAIFGLWARWKP